MTQIDAIMRLDRGQSDADLTVMPAEVVASVGFNVPGVHDIVGGLSGRSRQSWKPLKAAPTKSSLISPAPAARGRGKSQVGPLAWLRFRAICDLVPWSHSL